MKGAVAAGHPLTAEAGARILAEGGNAFDACIAATFVSWVAESPLTGPGGGGFLLAHRAGDRSDALLDFFVTSPGRGFGSAPAEMTAVDVSFDGRTSQLFRIGGPSCAVPGSPAGLAAAHRLYARLPWPMLLEPAIEVAAAGVSVTAEQAFLHDVLDGILRFAPATRRIYGEDACLVTGDLLSMADLADTLRLLADEGVDAFYGGEVGRAIAATVQETGGSLTVEDLSAYRVIRRRPVRAAYRGGEFVSNPPPSSGGTLIAFGLAVLELLGETVDRSTARGVAFLAETMREASSARTRSFVAALHRGGLARRLLADHVVAESAARVREQASRGVRESAGLPSTTHVSVVDAEGNAASLSASTGCGSGIVVPGTGIHVNNMLGEEDLNPAGGPMRPGHRLTSMMAPSMLLISGRPRLVVGSAGSERLRGAILQTLVEVAAGRPVRAAVDAPRLHVAGEVLHLEGGFDDGVATSLVENGYQVVRWRERNLYFGGVAAVTIGPDGRIDAAGDPRRGGAGRVVE